MYMCVRVSECGVAVTSTRGPPIYHVLAHARARKYMYVLTQIHTCARARYRLCALARTAVVLVRVRPNCRAIACARRRNRRYRRRRRLWPPVYGSGARAPVVRPDDSAVSTKYNVQKTWSKRRRIFFTRLYMLTVLSCWWRPGPGASSSRTLQL